jgi:hypothetical protein
MQEGRTGDFVEREGFVSICREKKLGMLPLSLHGCACVVTAQRTHSVRLCVWEGRWRLIQMTFRCSGSIGEMLANHFGRKPRKLVCPHNISRRDCTQKGCWGGIPHTGVDETDVTGVVVPSDVVGLHIDAARRSLYPSVLHRVGGVECHLTPAVGA